MDFSTGILVFITVVSYLAYRYLIRVYGYWENRNVAGPTPVFPFGNTLDFARQKKSFSDLVTYYYNEFPQEKFVGLFEGRTPLLIIRDPECIKHVILTDFICFRNRNKPIYNSPLEENLFFAQDERWRFLRRKLTTIFSSGKLKNMFPLMNKCMKQFQQYMEQLMKTDSEVEMRQLMEKSTLPIFGSCFLGIDMKTCNDQKNQFINIGKRIFTNGLKTSLAVTLDSAFPGIVKYLKIKCYRQDVIDFFLELVKDLGKKRNGNPVYRKDFMDLLLELKEQMCVVDDLDEGKTRDKKCVDITNELLAAQLLVFYAAGFNGSSATASFLLYELALHQDIQDKVYSEIRSVTDKYDGTLTYDAMQEMNYLGMVMAETLRMYPIGGLLFRKCTTDYTFPGTNVNIEKGIKIVIPSNAIHKDPQYYENPEKFNPDRFTPENLRKLHQYTYLPFGEGPRSCIGTRFAKIQSMVGVAGLLLKYRVLPSARTKPVIVFKPSALTLESADGIWANIQRRE